MLDSHRDIQVFLGLANFYRRFIKKFLRIVQPMTAMLKGGNEGKIFGPFEPTTEMQEAFWHLQSEFTKAPVLAHFDYKKPICLETDAFGFALAGTILQPTALPTSGEERRSVKDCDWHPIALWLRTMADAEQNNSGCDQEMLAIVEACRHWRHYLEGSKYPVQVLTDHHNLQGFIKNKRLRGRLGRWWETLSGDNLEIVYRTGKTNSVDGPSCRPYYKATAEAENRQKQAQETRAGESGNACAGKSEKARTAKWEEVRAGESDEVHEKVVRIDAAQLLGLWGQQLAAIVCCRLPMPALGSHTIPTGCSRPWSDRRKQKERRSSCQACES